MSQLTAPVPVNGRTGVAGQGAEPGPLLLREVFSRGFGSDLLPSFRIAGLLLSQKFVQRLLAEKL